MIDCGLEQTAMQCRPGKRSRQYARDFSNTSEMHHSCRSKGKLHTLRASVFLVLFSSASLVTKFFKSTSNEYLVGMMCW